MYLVSPIVSPSRRKAVTVAFTAFENQVARVRPSSRLDSYAPQTESQKLALANLTALAAAIVRKGDAISTEPHPFAHGRIIFLSGPPGVGKTHLVEGLVNEVLEKDPRLDGKVFLFRGDLNVYFTRTSEFDGCPVVVIDDLYAELQSLDRLHPVPDIRSLMELVTLVYEQRRLLILTSNFQMMEGMVTRIAEVDEVGRVTSRLRELMANSGELVLDGSDYRLRLAEDRDSNLLFEDL